MIAEADRRIRALRGPREPVDPWKPLGAQLDAERRPGGRTERALTIFLAGSECPFTCSFCDLWRFTLEGPTPAGALPRQIGNALASFSAAAPDGAAVERIKLYNASNFFDARAVPREDLPRIAELCAPFAGVTVESHAGMVGPHVLDFAARLGGQLEVAMGLETVHADALARLNKRLDLARFDRACEYLHANGIALRVFVLLGAPHVPPPESVAWTVRSAAYAAERGAAVVSIIPVRAGNGELERLAASGLFAPPTLAQLEDALEQCLALRTHAAIAADLWDVHRIAACEHCRAARVERLRRMNATGVVPPRIACDACDACDVCDTSARHSA